MRSKKREPWYLAKVDVKVKSKVKKEADRMGISTWLLVEHLLNTSLTGTNAASNKLLTKTR